MLHFRIFPYLVFEGSLPDYGRLQSTVKAKYKPYVNTASCCIVVCGNYSPNHDQNEVTNITGSGKHWLAKSHVKDGAKE